MARPFQRIRRFLRELEQRKVYSFAAGYLISSFVVLQLADLSADAFGFPCWLESGRRGAGHPLHVEPGAGLAPLSNLAR